MSDYGEMAEGLEEMTPEEFQRFRNSLLEWVPEAVKVLLEPFSLIGPPSNDNLEEGQEAG